MQIVIVYGSAADPANPAPRDVDVAYTGPKATAQAAVAAWAARRGLADVPVDWHPAFVVDGTVILPAPCGLEGVYEILAGDAVVKWEGRWELSSWVRAYGDDPARLAAELGNGEARWRLTVVPAPGLEPEREYVEGLAALRSAVSKRPAARRVLAAQWPALFPALLDWDPQPGEGDLEVMREASPWASSGAVILVLTPRGVRLQHGSGDEDAATMLYPETMQCWEVRVFVPKGSTDGLNGHWIRLEMDSDGRVSWRLGEGGPHPYEWDNGGETFEERGRARFDRAVADLLAGDWEELK